MYENIEKKIKTLATGTFLVVSIVSVIVGIILAVEIAAPLILLALIGPTVAWISSWLLYGFGEIIDMLRNIERNTTTRMKSTELKKLHNPIDSKEKKTGKANSESNGTKEAIAKATIAEENSIIIDCPECGMELFFDKALSNAECPYCNCNIKIKQ